MKRDILIIGAGGAGLRAAIHAKEQGMSVRVITKEYPTRSQTCMAQGGINAALANVSEDSVEAHIANTLKSAQGLADEAAVRFMCSEAPSAIEWLESIGVCFSRTADAKIAQRTLGGASAPRACYAQDYTGLKILHTLYDRCNQMGIEMLQEKFLLKLLKSDSNAVCGALVLDIRSGEIEEYRAGAVIMATGGYSRIYERHSTNSSASSGDGIIIAKEAGARLKDMEFVQFHPTALKNSAVLISESARGEGGYLLNSKQERFTDELAPRDVVSRAIDEQMKRGEDIFLDIRHLGEAFIDEGLPQERKLAKLYEGVDPVDSLIPIRPVAHYTMGGIEVDADSKTAVAGLFACGECANHNVHGANRLGGNSLLEIVVFAKQAAQSAVEYAESQKALCVESESGKELFSSTKVEIDFYQVRQELGDILYEKVGIVRTKERLQEALDFIQKAKSELPLMGAVDTNKSYNTNRIEFLEFQNIVALSEIVVQAALKRDVSCGAHYMAESEAK